ncbi:hypothetical protein [Krasilnikovia sp. MM14-A1259]|uniref:hypothetical protein n=1 Tax=Krasilnikovia sp. MM14-A1259 TaxID=3373539 RepID=UPI00381EB563
MTDTAVPQTDCDEYEYDEAHDADGRTPRAVTPPPPLRMPAGMHVTDIGGDYGYDCAHDLG